MPSTHVTFSSILRIGAVIQRAPPEIFRRHRFFQTERRGGHLQLSEFGGAFFLKNFSKIYEIFFGEAKIAHPFMDARLKVFFQTGDDGLIGQIVLSRTFHMGQENLLTCLFSTSQLPVT